MLITRLTLFLPRIRGASQIVPRLGATVNLKIPASDQMLRRFRRARVDFAIDALFVGIEYH